MDFLELAKKRYSVRSYSDRPVEKEKLNYVLECARLAPSATNAQPWKIYVIEDNKIKEKLSQCYPAKWFGQAPIIIVICVEKGSAWVRSYDQKNHYDIDGAIITEHLCLAATDCGLGTCWVCHFNPEKVSEILNLPLELTPVVLLPIGYPSTDIIPEKKRKPMDEIVKFL